VIIMVCGGAALTALGVIAAVLVVKRLVFRAFARRHGFYGYGYGGACGGGGFRGGCGPRGFRRGFDHDDDDFDGPPFGRFGRGFGGPRIWLRGLFARLETTPSQEKVIVSAISDVREVARRAKGRAPEVREDVSRAFRADILDEAALGAAQAKVDSATSEIRIAIAEALRKIHEVLDDKQRGAIADFLSRGGARSLFRGGPYRSVSL
jgi:uncharacterized membrane protein